MRSDEMRVKLLLILLIIIMSGCGNRSPLIINSFTVSSTQINQGDAVTFSWKIANNGGKAYTCTLDAEGDEVVNYSITNGAATQQHTYISAGIFTATLFVSDNGGNSDSKQIVVDVDGPLKVSIEAPTVGQVVDKSLDISVGVVNQYEIQEVKASVGGSEVLLNYINGKFSGNISLNSLEAGNKILAISAKDSRENTAAAYQSFIKNELPTLTVTEPLEGTVAKPNIHIKATSSKDSKISIYWKSSLSDSGTKLIEYPNNEVDADINLSAYKGLKGFLTLVARNSLGQYAVKEINIIVISNSFLTPVVTIPGTIMDYNDEVILYSSDSFLSNGSYTKVFLNNRLNGNSESISIPDGNRVGICSTTSNGAMLSVKDYLDNPLALYYFSNGSLVKVDDYACLIKVAGDFASYITQNARLWFYQLSSGSKVDLDNGKYGFGDIAANGRVVFIQEYGYTLCSYYNGVLSKPDTDSYAFNPRTDGNLIVYSCEYYTPYCNFKTVLNDGTNEIFLTDNIPISQYHHNYLCENGWITFCQPGTSGQSQVWLRDPSGQVKQITDFATSSEIVALGSNGEVIISCDGKFFIGSFNGFAREIGYIPQVDYTSFKMLAQKWYVNLGGSLFKINL